MLTCSYESENAKTPSDVDLDGYVKGEESVIKNDMGCYVGELTPDQKKFLIVIKPCRPMGPFPRDSKGRSFSNFFYYKISKDGTFVALLFPNFK